MYGLHLTRLRIISEYKNPEDLNPLLLSCCVDTVHMNLSVVCSSVPATEGKACAVSFWIPLYWNAN